MFLGIDTSNYTTSLALFDGKNVIQQKQLLEVKDGERGLRQSDAVFQHTVNMPILADKLEYDGSKINAVAVSAKPRNVDGSYMPCFNVGISTAKSISKFICANYYETSHQVGHILSALYSADKLKLVNAPFICFHVSGGTTEALLVTPSKSEIIEAKCVSQSLDLKAGQAVDRTGVLLGLKFPCGQALDSLSLKSDREFKVKPSMIGNDCSLSGVENKVKNMISSGEKDENIAKFLFTYIGNTLVEMSNKIILEYGNLPLVFAGGVMSNTVIRKIISEKFDAIFAKPEFSCDNAAGTAIFAYMKYNDE